MSAVMRSGSAAVGLAKARAGTAVANRKFTLAGVTAGIKLVEEDADIALFDHDGGRLRLTHAGQASPSAWRETNATEWQFGWGIRHPGWRDDRNNPATAHRAPVSRA